MAQENDQTVLDEAVRAVLDVWIVEHSRFPEVLYHYTSADGVIGILTNQSFWATDLRYMNDLSELQYSSDLISDRIARRAEADDLTEVQAEFLRRSARTFNPFQPGSSVFAACFCEDGNLLSQWRAYRGSRGGYALGFDFFHTLRLLDRPCVLRKVTYDRHRQHEHVDAALDKFLAVIGAHTSGRTVADVTATFLPAACRSFAAVMGEFLFSSKHPDFREEREWRLVHFASSDPRVAPSTNGAKFHSYDGNIIPYFEVGFRRAIDASKDDTLGIGFPIVDIMIGPTVNAELNQEAARSLLLALNPEIEPRIRHSGIPLRWL